MKVTLRQYYRTYKSVQGCLAGLPFVPPLLSSWVSDSSTMAGYIFPPLGDSGHIVFLFTLVLLLAATYAMYWMQDGRTVSRWIPLSLMLSLVLGVMILIALYTSFVRVIEIPGAKMDVPVSIGYKRTEFARRTYPQSDDWAILHDRGPWEEQIQEIWTRNSIAAVRAMLWGSYTVCLLSLALLGSLLVYGRALEEQQVSP